MIEHEPRTPQARPVGGFNEARQGVADPASLTLKLDSEGGRHRIAARPWFRALVFRHMSHQGPIDRNTAPARTRRLHSLAVTLHILGIRALRVHIDTSGPRRR